MPTEIEQLQLDIAALDAADMEAATNGALVLARDAEGRQSQWQPAAVRDRQSLRDLKMRRLEYLQGCSRSRRPVHVLF